MIHPKLFVTDLDGTLLEDDHFTVSERNRAALKALQAQGIKLCACTGRVLCVLPKAVEELEFDYAITSNGGSCIDLKTGEHIFTAYLPERLARQAWEYIEPTSCFTEWFVKDDILMDRERWLQWPARLKAPWHREYLGGGKGIVVDDIHEFFDQGAPGLEKISVFDCPKDMRERVIDPLLATGEFEISTSLGINFEISHILADKGSALKTLCRHMGISPEAAIAFGDGGNDVKLMDAAGTAVAMGNAVPALKERADVITKRNSEDGVAVYLEENVLK